MSGEERRPNSRDDVLEMGECGLPEAEWRALLSIDPELALTFAAAREGLRAARWDALERLLALLPPGGGTVDECFNRLQPPVPAEPGEPISAEERDWVLVAAYGTLGGAVIARSSHKTTLSSCGGVREARENRRTKASLRRG